jgi:hypothetical protein
VPPIYQVMTSISDIVGALCASYCKTKLLWCESALAVYVMHSRFSSIALLLPECYRSTNWLSNADAVPGASADRCVHCEIAAAVVIYARSDQSPMTYIARLPGNSIVLIKASYRKKYRD